MCMAGQPINRKTRFHDLPDFLSVEEFRSYLGLGRTKIYELLRSGEIQSLKFGRIIRIPKAVLCDHQTTQTNLEGS